MEQLTLSKQQPNAPSILLLLFLLGLLALLYYRSFTTPAGTGDGLTSRMRVAIAIPASEATYRSAIELAAKNLALMLGIELENYDISSAEYQALVDAATKKFGHCEQYRLYSIAGGWYPCYACLSKPRIELLAGQTYRIGQTRGDQKTRYSQGLPEPGLFYLVEYRGNVFDVLVAEHVKLQLFRFSRERQQMIEWNRLATTELILPPANKILR